MQYDEDKEQFYVSGGEGKDSYAAPSLKKLKAMIDKDLAAQRKKFAGKEAYKYVYKRETPVIVTVTSVDDDGKRCWIRDESGSRTKAHVSGLYEVCPENEQILAEITKTYDEYQMLIEREQELKASLRRVSFR